MSRVHTLDSSILDDLNRGDENVFRISKGYKDLMIVVVILIFLNSLRYSFHGIWPEYLLPLEKYDGFISVFFIVVNGVSRYLFYLYFKHYKLSVLVWITILLFVAESFGTLYYLIDESLNVDLYWLEKISTGMSSVLTLLWVARTLKLKNEKMPGVKFLRYASISLIAAFLFCVSFGVFEVFLFDENGDRVVKLLAFSTIFYYLFIVKFVLDMKVYKS